MVGIDDFRTDSVGHPLADSYTAGKLADRGDDHSLLEGEGSRRDRRGEGVGDIVGAWTVV